MADQRSAARWAEIVEQASGARRSAPITLAAAGPGELIAWIESPVDIATLFIAGQGRIVLERALAETDTLDFGYEGCAAHHLAWHGEGLVVVTSERQSYYVHSLRLDPGNDTLLCLAYAWQIDGDLLLWVDRDPGLVCSATLPSLEARPPLPFRGVASGSAIRLRLHREAERPDPHLTVMRQDCILDVLRLPTEREREEYEPVRDLFDRVERRLFPKAKPPADARLIIEAVAHPFQRATPTRDRTWSPSPVWLPVYWYRYLNSSGARREARNFLDLLDQIASALPESQPEFGWDPGWSAREGQIELAVLYVRRQCRTIAGACRAGGLPKGWYCLLFEPAPRHTVAGSRVDTSAFPPTLRTSFELLATTNPKRLEQAK